MQHPFRGDHADSSKYGTLVHLACFAPHLLPGESLRVRARACWPVRLRKLHGLDAGGMSESQVLVQQSAPKLQGGSRAPLCACFGAVKPLTCSACKLPQNSGACVLRRASAVLQEPGPQDGDVGYVIVSSNRPAKAISDHLAAAPDMTMQVSCAPDAAAAGSSASPGCLLLALALEPAHATCTPAQDLQACLSRNSPTTDLCTCCRRRSSKRRWGTPL